MELSALVFVAIGALAISTAVFDWTGLWRAGTAQFLTLILTRDCVRIFYFLVGAAVIVLGVLALTGVIEFNRA